MWTIITWLTCAVFLVGGIVNGVGPGPLRVQYANWGYPRWFRFVTSFLELVAAGMLAFSASRVAGAVLGAAIAIAAIATLIRGGQYRVVPVPTVLLLLTILTGWAVM